MLILEINPMVTSRMADGGPVYFETDLSRLIAEPWNAFSSLAFLVPVVIFLWQLKGNYNKNRFLVYVCAPLLTIGGLGSTFFHALRTSPVFLIMDVMPIALLTLSVSLWFWYKIIPRWYFIVLLLVIITGLHAIPFYFLEGQTAINFSYIITGLMIFLPAIIYQVRTKFSGLKWLLLCILFFALALFFRYADDFPRQVLPMGIHWLWHISCALGAYMLGIYIKNCNSPLRKL